MTRTGHPDLVSAYADHARRRMTGDLLNLRPWPGWDVPGETAMLGECQCGSTLIIVTTLTGQRAANHDGYEIGESGC